MNRLKALKFSHRAMNTFFEVFVAGQPTEYSRSAARAFFQEVDRLESFLSRFDDRSEISRINRLGPGEMLPVGYETYECLKLSFELMVISGGAFNINFRALKRKEGDKGKQERSGSIRSIKNRRTTSEKALIDSASGLADRDEKSGRKRYLELFPLELVEPGGAYAAVRLDIPGAKLDLDLGAIGKGYALERAVGLFSDWGIKDFLVNAGGSTVYGCGRKPWPVAVGGGFDFFKPGKINLTGRALSGSGHEVKGEHIFDPRRSRSRSRHLAVWVSHPSPALADGLSTAFMVMSLEEIKTYTAAHPETWTLVLSRDKKSYLFNPMDIYEPGS